MKKNEIEKQLNSLTPEQLAQVAGGSYLNETVVPHDPFERLDIRDLLDEQSLMCW